jgi:hypothetical protein
MYLLVEKVFQGRKINNDKFEVMSLNYFVKFCTIIFLLKKYLFLGVGVKKIKDWC